MTADFWLGFATGLAIAFGLMTVAMLVCEAALEHVRRRL